jgi:DNA-binding MarR family transcriptional regulator
MSQAGDRVELETSLGYLLKETASALRAAMTAALAPHGMTVTYYACLELLAQRPGLSNAQLARGAFVSRQAMNVLLQSLERDGMVERATESPSGRALPTILTAQGRARLATASAAVRDIEKTMTSGLDAQQQEQLRLLLVQCRRSLSGDPAQERRDGAPSS